MCLNQESTKSHKMDTNSIPRIVIYIIRKVYERSLEGLGFRNFKKNILPNIPQDHDFPFTQSP
jgi:hypothetical protein